MNYRHPPDVLARALKLISLRQAQISMPRMVRQSLLQSISVRQSSELLESRFDPLFGIAFTVVNDSATPDGTVGGIAGGWNPTRQRLGGAKTHAARRAHRREAIARDPHGYDTPTGQDCPDPTASPWGSRPPARPATVCRTPLATPEATPPADDHRPDLTMLCSAGGSAACRRKQVTPRLTTAPQQRAPSTPQETPLARDGNTQAINRRAVLGSIATPQRKGILAVGLRTLHRTSFWTMRGAPPRHHTD